MPSAITPFPYFAFNTVPIHTPFYNFNSKLFQNEFESTEGAHSHIPSFPSCGDNMFTDMVEIRMFCMCNGDLGVWLTKIEYYKGAFDVWQLSRQCWQLEKWREHLLNLAQCVAQCRSIGLLTEPNWATLNLHDPMRGWERWGDSWWGRREEKRECSRGTICHFTHDSSNLN